MKRKKFTIKKEPRVGKTRVLYDGPEKKLRPLKRQLDGVRTSDIYPALESGFKNALYVYSADPTTISRLRNFCRDNLTGPGENSFASGPPDMILRFGKLSLLLIFGVIIVYVIFEMLIFIINIIYLHF